MRIALGNDHAGFPMIEAVKTILVELGVQVTHFGSYDLEPVDFPDIARLVCGAVTGGDVDWAAVDAGDGAVPTREEMVPGERFVYEIRYLLRGT